MARKSIRTVLSIIIGVTLLLLAFLKFFTEPFVKEKIHTSLNRIDKGIMVDVKQINISLFSKSLLLEEVSISPTKELKDKKFFQGTIGSIKISGIHVFKLLFHKDVFIDSVVVSHTDLSANIPFDADTISPVISAFNIQINQIFFNDVNLTIHNTQNPNRISIKEGSFRLYKISLPEKDTLDQKIIQDIDLKVSELTGVSADSNYTFKCSGLQYVHVTKGLFIDTFHLDPNFSVYAFTNRSRYETDRFDVTIKGLDINDVSIMHFIHSGNLLCNYVKIGYIDVHAFRDKRKEFEHIRKQTFQEMIYDFPGDLYIDSVRIIDGEITYMEHAEEATDAGYISFNNISASISNILNDTIYRTKEIYLNLVGRARLMNRGIMTVNLKARLFDPLNAMLVHGTLSAMDISSLNPMLENNASVYVSGYVDDLRFNFSANDKKAGGELTFRYHDLDLTLKNKKTDDTTAIKERLASFIAAIKTFNANPMPGKGVREGIIDYERDPEKFLFNYCFKSIFSGIKYTLTRNPKEKKDEE